MEVSTTEISTIEICKEKSTIEERTLRSAALFLVLLSAVVCIMIPYLPTLHTREVEAREERLAEEEYAESQIAMQDLAIKETGAAAMEGQLRIRLPEGVDGSSIEVNNDYVTQTVRVEIPETDMAYFDSYPVTGDSNYIDALSYTRQGEEGVVEVVTNQVYEIRTEYDSEYYYFNFLTPQEVYDKVVVIDAGHGGRAPGATKQGINEKDIDLAIVLQLQKIFEESDENIGVYYTRTDDSNPTFDQRVRLANKSNADLFISVHNNSTKSGRMSGTKGTQVMYDETSEAGKQFAQICLEEVTSEIGSVNKGLVKGDEIYIIRTSEVPVALIEVGFMTNREELALLNSEEYQRQTAQGIYNAVIRAFEEGY